MLMDPRFRGVRGSTNEIQLENQSFPILFNQRFENGFIDQSYLESNLVPDNTPSSSSILSHEEPSPEDCDFSDAVLSYINQILMEEEMEEKTCMLQDSLDLQIAERSFYEVIGEEYPPVSLRNPNDGTGHNNNLFDDYGSCHANDTKKYQVPHQNFQRISVSQSSYSSSNSVISNVEGPLDSPSSENQSIWQFQKGVEEASKFLPSEKGLFAHFNKEVSFLARSKGRKHYEEGDFEENRRSKQPALYSLPTLRSDMIDMMLLHSSGDGKKHLTARREAFMNNDKITKPKASKGLGKKQNERKQVIDLRTLLILCAQAVAADDHKSAHELLKQIRHHSSPFGDGNQRLAHVFADGLEARLAGTGSQIHKGLVVKRTSAADVLKAYHLYLAACPFRKMSSFISNVKIRSSSEGSMRIHVIDFGILYGFQWPTFIQRLSWRSGGPPKLRITGIDFPQPGFRPAERITETGRRLAAYAEGFNVPFEYNAIAKKWETIELEELKIDKDEYLVVTCFYRGKNLLDESVVVESPRDKFLSLIRKMNPDIFFHGIINGAFNAPFFVTRFKEALFHFSSLFDMLDTIVPREDWERMLIEKDLFGREALNVIACEGCERVERPESYKQWQVRTLRAGFSQQGFEREIVDKAKEKVRSSYHKDFVIDEDSRWLLQGWKGRIIYALSCWKPT